MKKILYIHGFASAFKPNGSKVTVLSKYFEVVPFSYDTGGFYQDNLQQMKDIIKKESIAVVMGSSMGGFYAIQLAAEIDTVVSVALNPSHELRNRLSGSIGMHKNFETGKTFELTEGALSSYPAACHKSGKAFIFFMAGDELLDAKKAEEDLSPYFDFTLLPGGQHRFENLDVHMPSIMKKIDHLRCL